MNNPQKPTPGSGPGKTEELKIEGPLSEKDEVKAAERKMTQKLKKPAKGTSK